MLIGSVMQKMSKEGLFDVLQVVTMCLLLIIPWFLAGLNMWGYLFSLIILIFIGFETLSIRLRGHTLSSRFWSYKAENKKKSVYILISMVVAWTILILHLTYK